MNTQPEPVKNIAETAPVAGGLGEVQAQAPQPEAPAQASEAISAAEVDHQSAQSQPVVPPTVAEPVAPPANNTTQIADSSEEAPITEPIESGDLENKYFKAADEAIDTLGEKPFEEEEKAEDLSQGYLHDRFGKEISKSDD